MDVIFTINAKEYKLNSKNVPLDTTLNHFIRHNAQLTGTKYMCLEGGCGACIVTAKGIHPVSKEKVTMAVNSCLVSVFSCHGMDIITIEGIGNKLAGYHPIQKHLANFNGSQCGYCSSGMVMNMYSLTESTNGALSMKDIENSFGGNICRCTGYRPILDAFKSMAEDATHELKNACPDIEELNKLCPKTGVACSGSCKSVLNNELNTQIDLKFDDGKQWTKAYSLKNLFEVLSKRGSQPYMLVAGNTAHGVYRRSDNLSIFIDISSVPELKEYKIEADKLTIGGGVSLTEAMTILTEAARKNPKFEYCLELVKHIDLVAHVPVRNVGTIAGNLAIKHQHNEFPSDVFLMMESIGAKITLLEAVDQSLIMTPADFLKAELDGRLIFNFILPPLDKTEYVYRSYKIMPRAQNAHAYVNAGFLLRFNDNRDEVKSARICFGGINPNFIHATDAEKMIVGLNIFNNENLQDILSKLSSEIEPDWVLPDASSEYRKTLALSLFYKFILNIAPNDIVQINPIYKSGGCILDRALSSGKQSFDTYEKNWPLTKNIPKIEGLAQTSGEAKYTNDIPVLPNELYGAFVTATRPNSKIAAINASDALKIPGVVAFYSAKDIPGKNNYMPPNLGNPDVEEIFCSGNVLYHGQPVGIIVASNSNLANKASKQVRITYEGSSNDSISGYLSNLLTYFVKDSEENKIYPTIQDVLKANAVERISKIKSHKTGKLYNKPTVGATKNLSGIFQISGQYHYTMETQTCVCVPIEDGMDVYSSTQWVDLVQVAIADMLKVPESSLNLYVRRLGGGYGAKISRPTHISCATALAAHLLQRPVRFVMTIEANMGSIGKRYGCMSNYAVEIDDDGKIRKLTNDYVLDMGCSVNESPAGAVQQFFQNCYDTSTWKWTGKEGKTDAPSNTWCRAPGTTEGIAMIENIMEHIAYVAGKDPAVIRLQNIPKGNKIQDLAPNFLKDVEYENRKKQINTFNETNRWRKRGIGITFMQYRMDHFGSCHALISIYHGDGSVVVQHGGIEMGQGINTKAAQTTAFMLGIPLDKISIKPTSSLLPNDIVSGGSQASEVSCYAIKKACEILLDRLKPVKAKKKNSSWEETIAQAHSEDIDLCATYMYKHSEVKEYDIWGLTCAEIEVDILTGNIQLKRVDILEDTGESMSPGVDIGQIEGAFIMGVGYHLTESLIYNNENGELLTNRTWSYKPPGAKDIPVDFRIKFLQKSSNPFGVLRSKATGEPALCMSIVVLFALRHALDSARRDAGVNEWLPLGAPTTVETTFLMAGNNMEHFKLN